MKSVYLSLMGILFLAGSFFTNPLKAQRDCGATEYLEMQMQQDPKRAIKMQQIEEQTRRFLQNSQGRAVNGVITIPVVVHIVYNNATENISDAQIQSQLDVINADFRRTNSDADNVWSQAADSEIEFCMATVDPSGNPTNGITRTSTTRTSFSTNDDMKFDSRGGKDAWPRDDYLNMWVCDISGGILGYAQFPGGPAATDGVVMDYQYFGTIGTATAPFDLGRTTTHEIGHWLNLRHIWGDGGCGVDDFVSDTPESDAPNYGCALGHTSCGSTDMVQNYMDYSDDACMNLYTFGQKARMRALFDNGGARESLLSSGGCGTPAPPTCDDGIQNGNETGVDCGGPDCDACPPCTDVVVSILTDNYPGETTWQITDAGGAVVASGGPYGNNGTLFTSTECLVDGCFDFTIFDSYGDGICCAYGIGEYTVTVDGQVVASGGEFGASETTNFCVGGGPSPTCDDGIQNGNETGVDCGGPDCPACPTCDDGVQNGNETGVDCGGPDCAACPTCDDGIQNGNETGVDCGGPDCAACPTCDDGVQNGNETGVDCGGPDCAPCTSCNDGIQNGNETGVDCGGSDCPACPTCDDGIQNGDETGIDCGGSDCPACPTCDDGVQNGNETGVDCGGPDCAACPTCDDGVQNGNETGVDCGGPDCVACPTCDDGIQNGNETGVDCGGPDCAACPTCDDGVQNGDETGVDCGGPDCAACPTCDDGVQNGNETGVDCGGPDCPACPPPPSCTDVVVTINLDNYPEETSWNITDAGGAVVASGGTYPNQPDGSTVQITECLDDGCYDFTIFDSYGDGICCGYGLGSYTVTVDGQTVASGGEFGSSETTNFCIGEAPAPSCDDGIQNGNETGVDCGGPDCAPCETGCSTVQVDNEGFESGWGIWNDGGSDCRRSINDAQFANNGNYCVRLRDNTSSSVMTTDILDLAGFEEVTIDFSYLPVSMENNEDFWLQVSIDGGAYQTLAIWASNSEFTNNVRENESVVITGNFTSNVRFRFRCDASGNGDRIYIDDVNISGCSNGGARMSNEELLADEEVLETLAQPTLAQVLLFPNPTSDLLNVDFTFNQKIDGQVQVYVTDITGKMVQQLQWNATAGKQRQKVDVSQMAAGIYLLHLINGDERVTQKFVVTK